MSSGGRIILPPHEIAVGQHIAYFSVGDNAWYVGEFRALVESLNGVRLLLRFGDREERVPLYTECYATTDPVSPVAPRDTPNVTPLSRQNVPAAPPLGTYPLHGVALLNANAGRGRARGAGGPQIAIAQHAPQPVGFAQAFPGPVGRGAPAGGLQPGQGRGVPVPAYNLGRGGHFYGPPGQAIPGQGRAYPGALAPVGRGGPPQGAPGHGVAPNPNAPGNNAVPPAPGPAMHNQQAAGNAAAPGYPPTYATPGAGPSNNQGTPGGGNGGNGAQGSGSGSGSKLSRSFTRLM